MKDRFCPGWSHAAALLLAAVGAALPLPAAEALARTDEASLRKLAVSVAGARWHAGGMERRPGLDGAGMVSLFYRAAGWLVPDSDVALSECGRAVGRDALQAWDLVLLMPGGPRAEAGLGIALGPMEFLYTGRETGKVVFARIDEDPWDGRVVGGRRLLGSECVEKLARAEETRPEDPDDEEELQPSVKVSRGLKLNLPAARRSGRIEVGIASYYGGRGDRFSGSHTSSGERMNPAAMTAAHRTHPFGTLLKVTNLSTGSWVVVRVNDRGPHRRGRIVDVSRGAARRLGFVGKGLCRVRVEVVGR